MTSQEIKKKYKSIYTIWSHEMEKLLKKNIENPYAVVNEIENNDELTLNQKAWIVQRYCELNNPQSTRINSLVESLIQKYEVRIGDKNEMEVLNMEELSEYYACKKIKES